MATLLPCIHRHQNITFVSRASHVVCNAVVRLDKAATLSLAEAATSITFVAKNACLYAFVATKHVFCRDKNMLVATKLCLSVLSRRKFCRDKHSLFATKIRLVAAPANDTTQCQYLVACLYNVVAKDLHMSMVVATLLL